MTDRPSPAQRDHDRRLDRRQWAERVLEHARHLPLRDRLLLEQLYRHGLSLTQVAQLLGKDRKAVARHVARLLRRIRQPVFPFVAHRADLIPRDIRTVARLTVLEDHSLRDTAQITGRSLHRVRRDMQTLAVIARLLA